MKNNLTARASVTIELTDLGARTRFCLSQDDNTREAGRQHSERNWSVMLAGLKSFVEKSSQPDAPSGEGVSRSKDDDA